MFLTVCVRENFPQVAYYRTWSSSFWKINISLTCSMKWKFCIHKQSKMDVGKHFTLQNSCIYLSSIHLLSYLPSQLFCTVCTNLGCSEHSGFFFKVLVVFTLDNWFGKLPHLPCCHTTGGHEAPLSSNAEAFLHCCWLEALRKAIKKHQSIHRI